ncbi:MAG: homocysteine biosynthesis protein [Candidatus Marinimicrobia bacterium]|nr:homocysteine biosynthesis protein [Candidatus Neomarinimicrobiota bacterium]
MPQKTIDEINAKIKSGKSVVLTAEEVSKMGREKSAQEIASQVDVVTTATFGPMCSSGIFMNFGHADPPIRMQEVTLNNVEAYAGLAAVDVYLGATQTDPDNPKYGGAHVIQELIEGKSVHLKAKSTGTDCYPGTSVDTQITKDSINELYMYNPRNAYQNYPVATNTTNRHIYTYMGSLLPNLNNATYSTSGELSPLLNDPEMETIGIGTKIFLGGTTGFVSWQGTQFHTTKPKNEFGIPLENAATLALIGNLKDMSSEFIQAAYFEQYGVSIFIGLGIPIPILNEDIAKAVMIRNEQIETTICDYGTTGHPAIGRTNYKELQTGSIKIDGKKVRTAPMSSIPKARKIAASLKEWIEEGEFTLSEPVQAFPKGTSLKSLNSQGDK